MTSIDLYTENETSSYQTQELLANMSDVLSKLLAKHTLSR